MTRAEADKRKASRRISALFEKPASDPIWHDDQFWQVRWPRIVDNYAQAVEAVAMEARP